MAGIFFVDHIRRVLAERNRQKRVQAAATWPKVAARINHWKVLPAGDASDSFTNTNYIEAAFHFTLRGDYYGGYVKSVPMSHREAEKLATGAPEVMVRYHPANPDETVVLAEDNRGNLPFQIVSG